MPAKRWNPRSLAARRAARSLPWLLAAALGGCFATEPQLYPFAPPANVPAGLVLLQVPEGAVNAMRSTNVADELASVLLGNALKIGYEPITNTRKSQILAHKVVTGMTVREVQWSLVAEPVRIREQGPPGGSTLIWETPGNVWGSYWVRFDDQGRAADAGSF